MGHHAANSPSGFYQELLCPGSRNAQKGLPNVNSDAAILGTAAHTMLEMVLKGNKAVRNLQTLVVPNDPDVGGTTELDADNTSAVREAIAYIESIPGAIEVEAEQQVDPADFMLRDDMYGTLDVRISIDFLGEKAIEICDYKNGFVTVEVEANSQLILYVLGVIAKMLKTDPTFVPDDYLYRLTIIQPRAYHPEGSIRSVEYCYSELLDFADEYRKAAELADQPDAPRVPGVKQCRYCRAKMLCKEFNNYALVSIQGGLEDPRLSPEVTLEEALLRDPKTLTVDQLRTILDAEPLITAFLKSVRAYSESAYRAGLRGFGYKMVAGRGTKAWREDEKVIRRKLLTLTKVGGDKLQESDITNPAKLLTPKQTMDRLKTQVDEETFRKINTLIENGNQKPKLVPETDAAPSIAVEVSDYFENPKDDLVDEFFK